MSADIELTLALSPEQLARLRSHTLVRGYMRPGANRTRLIKTYYDTPQLLLREHAVALGVENSGGRQVQTVASSDAVASETARSISGDAPDVAQLPDWDWRKHLCHESDQGKLAPVFTAEIERSRVPLQVEDSRIDLALETGHIRANGREQPICEARLALIAGQPERFYQLALDLHDRVPFRIEHRDNVQRGYGLLAVDPPKAIRATDVKFAPDAAIGPVFHLLAQAGLAHLCANEDSVLHARNPEALHQMRVAVRRLRALLAAFHSVLDRDATEFLRSELKWLQNQLGPARDWDVFLHGTWEPLAADNRDEPSLSALRSAAEAVRGEAYDVALDTLGVPRYTRLLLRFRLWLDSVAWEGKDAPAALTAPATSLAETILARRQRKLEKLGNRFSGLDEAGMHQVRLRAKKLRYATEFFRPVYQPKHTKKFIHTVTEIQDTLGSLHDAIVGRELLTNLKTRHAAEEGTKDSHMPGLERAAEVVAEFQAARIADSIHHFKAVWPRFTKLKKFWRNA